MLINRISENSETYRHLPNTDERLATGTLYEVSAAEIRQWLNNTNLIGLSDTPTAYAGSAGKALVVNTNENGVTFASLEDVYNINLKELVDVSMQANPREKDILMYNIATQRWRLANMDTIISLLDSGEFTSNKMMLIKRGALASITALSDGELGFTTDEKQLYIGSTAGNLRVQMEYDKGEAGGYAPLNDSSKIPVQFLPDTIFSHTYTVASEASMLELASVYIGDVCFRTDESKTYINVTGTNTNISDWQFIGITANAVTSVMGKSGAVTLTPSEIGAEPAFIKYSAFNKNFGITQNEVARGNHLHTDSYEPINANIQTHIADATKHFTQAEISIQTSQVPGLQSAISSNTDLITALNHKNQKWDNPHDVTKIHVGLSNVDNIKQIPLTYLDTNVLLGPNNNKIPSQLAVKTYTDSHFMPSSITVYNPTENILDEKRVVAFWENDESIGYMSVVAADNRDPQKMPALGVLQAAIAPYSLAVVSFRGLVTGINTSTFEERDILFVGVDGLLTNEKPLGNRIIQIVGFVVEAAESGKIWLYGNWGINNYSEDLIDGGDSEEIDFDEIVNPMNGEDSYLVVDANTVDGHHASDFAESVHTHTEFTTNIVKIEDEGTIPLSTDIALVNPDSEITLTLPVATANNGKHLNVKNIGEVQFILTAGSGEYIDNLASKLLLPKESVYLISDGTDWWVL